MTTTRNVGADTTTSRSEGSSAPVRRVRSTRIDRKAVGSGIALLVVAIVLPVFPAGGFTDYWVGQLASGPVYAIAILSLVVLARATASISLCQAAFMGVSAYAFSFLSISPEAGGAGWALLPAALVGTLIVAPVGMGLAFPALRMRGIELALLTLTVGAALNGLIFVANAPLAFSETSGAFTEGLSEPFGLNLSDANTKYYFALGVAAIVFALVGLVLVSPIGSTWKAMRAGNAVAAASGIKIAHYQLIGFGLSALLAGIAGVMLVILNSIASPEAFSVGPSIMFVIIAMVAGIDRLRAAVVGGLVTGLGTGGIQEFNIDGQLLAVFTGFVLVVVIVIRGRESKVLEQQ